jgi:hypothetical protein
VTNKNTILRNKKEINNEKQRKRNANTPIQEYMHRCHTINGQSPKPISITMTVKALTANLSE